MRFLIGLFAGLVLAMAFSASNMGLFLNEMSLDQMSLDQMSLDQMSLERPSMNRLIPDKAAETVGESADLDRPANALAPGPEQAAPIKIVDEPLEAYPGPQQPAATPDENTIQPSATLAASTSFQTIWSPFRSEASATGFAEILAEQTGHEFRVVRISIGKYQVGFDAGTQDEQQRIEAAIREATGVGMIGGSSMVLR
jgi:hypothetical protein